MELYLLVEHFSAWFCGGCWILFPSRRFTSNLTLFAQGAIIRSSLSYKKIKSRETDRLAGIVLCLLSSELLFNGLFFCFAGFGDFLLLWILSISLRGAVLAHLLLLLAALVLFVLVATVAFPFFALMLFTEIGQGGEKSDGTPRHKSSGNLGVLALFKDLTQR